MKVYKFELIRIRIITGEVKELEELVNSYSKKGWEFKSAQFFNDILCFLIVFEKSINKEGEKNANKIK